jgi:hypothetical protein
MSLRTAAQQALEALGKWSSGRDIDAVQLNDLIATLESALEQPEQATGKESLQVGQEEPEGGWQSAPSPQVTQRIADMPMSEYRRGVNDGFKLGLREGRIKAEDEMREQTVQEPVAWACFKNGELQTELVGTEADVDFWCASDEPEMQGMVKGALYTHPPRREWRGLKEWEINDGLDQLPTEDLCNWSFRQGVYFAEAALRSKNHE